MRIVFAGTPQPAVPSLLALVDAGHEVPLVITRPDAPIGRRRVLTPSPVASNWALQCIAPRASMRKRSRRCERRSPILA